MKYPALDSKGVELNSLTPFLGKKFFHVSHPDKSYIAVSCTWFAGSDELGIIFADPEEGVHISMTFSELEARIKDGRMS